MKQEIYNQRYENYKFYIKQPVLDIGGYDGSFLECIGVSEGTIIEQVIGSNKKFDFIVADISKKLPELGKINFKTIFLTEVLEHLRNPLYLMAQVYDLLDNDGSCYISIPYTKINIKDQPKIGMDLGHVSRWTLKEIINQMNKIGFNTSIIQTRRRFKGTAFYLPHCWIVLELTKQDAKKGSAK